jgi:hypothetical protein
MVYIMNTLWIDLKYANLLSGKLEFFKVKKNNPYLANCRCPFCGDSQKNKYKARGYVFQHKNEIGYKCHNCGIAYSFSTFLKNIDFIMYEEYTKEVYLSKNNIVEKREPVADITKIVTPKFLNAGSPLRKLKRISQLPWDHPAKRYVDKRKIPPEMHYKLFYCPKFFDWTNSIVPDKITATKEEPRLIIPFLKEDSNMFGYQGRSFDPKSKLRYITIMLEDYPKIYGLERVNKNQTVYVFEGPIDSMFIKNSVAMAGADVTLDDTFIKPVFVYDNEPRNKDIVKRIDSCIEKGYNVVVWDDTFPQKDINDMILAGHDVEHIKIVIDKRTFSGLEAKVELMKWRKCE